MSVLVIAYETLAACIREEVLFLKKGQSEPNQAWLKPDCSRSFIGSVLDSMLSSLSFLLVMCNFSNDVGVKSQSQAHVKHTRTNIVGIKPLPYNIRKGELKIATLQSPSSHIRCAAALNTTCAAASTATQTQTRNARSMTITPDKVRSPKLDNNGPGLPPRDDDGNGGNGGGGGKWSGGLPLLGILGVLDVLKDIEKEWQHNQRRRS
ncbi:hypothetical protein CR513_10084, partial [Mucuna pruriens]